MFKNLIFLAMVAVAAMSLYCGSDEKPKAETNLRGLADTVGFAHTARQMDSVMARIERNYGKERQDIMRSADVTPETAWKMIICPHDDYSYAGEMYPYVIKNLKAPTIILFGVAHKARLFNADNRIVFDTFDEWRGPYGNIPVSPLREEIMAKLPVEYYEVNDSLQEMEHSVEALLPFIQYYHRNFEIVSILVPYMNYEHIQKIGGELAKVIAGIVKDRDWEWGKDYAFAISNDCVHYGDEDWGGSNYARFGADSAGYHEATNYDMNIINECLIDQIDPVRVQRFIGYTVQKDDYKQYAWTWCGRYSVPFGLLTAYYLQEQLGKSGPPQGKMLRYSTSISNQPIKVDDLGMGITAPANIHHWVGYVSVGYE